MTGSLAIVLHAHLPWVLPDAEGAACSFEEAWLHEALWESYLPLLDVLGRARAGAPSCVLSVSPTLLAMLRSPMLPARFRAYLDTLRARIARARAEAPSMDAAALALTDRLNASAQAFERAGGDLTKALAALADRGAVELGTTSATHAILPSTLTEAGARAQLRMGLRYARHALGRAPGFFWLPECAWHPKLTPLLGDAGITSTVVDAHAFELAEPRPRHGVLQPVSGGEPFAFFARHTALSNAIWSNETGYPASAAHRDFHRAEDAASPEGRAVKLRAVGGGPYDPRRAAEQVRADAADFLARAEAELASSSAPRPLALVAFDAELFGHWWWEGPAFLEAVLEGATRASSKVALTTPGTYLAGDPALAVARPVASTWGRGGFLDVWSHPRVSHAHRVVQRAERTLLSIDALVRDEPTTETQRRARILAIEDLFLLQSSDLLFMLRTGQSVPFAEGRLRALAGRIDRLARLFGPAARPADARPADHGEATRARCLFAELEDDAFADCFDAF